MPLPTPSSVCTVSSMKDYHIVTFGDDSTTHVITVYREGVCHDSYVVAGGGFDRTGQYITLPFVR